MPKKLTKAEKDAIENFLSWSPESIIAKRLWDAGYRTPDLFPDGVLGNWMKRIPEPFYVHFRNCFRTWERQSEQGETLCDVRRLGGIYENVALMPTEIPTIKG